MRLSFLSTSVLAIVCVTALSGCATTPVSNSNAKPVPVERIISKSSQLKKTGDATVNVKRDAGFIGSGCNIVVYLDGKPIAELDTAEKVTFYAQPGEHILSVKQTSICVAGLKEIAISLKENDEKTYRIGFGGNVDMSINATAF